jgi:DNA-binding transcriptional regulator YhcF (GntR family)
MAYQMGPRSRRIHEHLRERIIQGELTPGTKLPSHVDLAIEYGVAPLTVRQVLAHLESEGLVSREQRRGTFVREALPPSVLIVEDDPHIGELLSEIIRTSGARAVLRSDPKSARAALETETGIDLVLSDVRMPEARDGVESIRGIRRRFPDLPVAAVTAFPGDLAALHGTPEAPVLVLSKPFRAAQVREALRMARGTSR